LVAGLGGDGFDHTVFRRAQLVFHLHRFEDDEELVLRDLLAWFGKDFDDAAGHGRADDVRAACAFGFGGGVGEVFEESVAALVVDVNASLAAVGPRLADLAGDIEAQTRFAVPFRIGYVDQLDVTDTLVLDDETLCVCALAQDDDRAAGAGRAPYRTAIGVRKANGGYCAEGRREVVFGVGRFALEPTDVDSAFGDGIAFQEVDQEISVGADANDHRMFKAGDQFPASAVARLIVRNEFGEQGIVVPGCRVALWSDAVSSNVAKTDLCDRAGLRRKVVRRILGAEARFDRVALRRAAIVRPDCIQHRVVLGSS